MFNLQMKCLKNVGFYRENNWRNSLQQSVCISGVLFVIISQFIFVLRHLDDVLISAEATATLFTTCLTLTKFLTFWMQKEDFYKLMDRTNQISMEIFDQTTLEKIKNRERIVTSTYLTSGGFTALAYCIAPIVISAKDFFVQGTDFRPGMPYKSEFFFDVTKYPALIFSFVGFCISSYTTISVNVS